MKVTDFQHRDWLPYVGNSYVDHPKFGPVYITDYGPDSGSLHAQITDWDNLMVIDTIDVDASLCTTMFPSGKCVNVYGYGIHVSRTAMQRRGRSASINHYQISWTPPGVKLVMDKKILKHIVAPTYRYPEWDDAIAELRTDGGVMSRAVSPDIILWCDGADINVQYRWWQAGIISPLGQYDSCYGAENIVKLARFALMEINAPCL